MGRHLLIAAGILVWGCGCTSLPSKHVDALRDQLAQQRDQLRKLQEENSVLKRELSLIKSKVVAAPLGTPAVMEPEGDQILYGRALDAFEKGKKEELARAVQLLEKGYPDSEHLDNALYLLGVQQFKLGAWPEALKVFSSVSERFPLGNKMAAALHYQAMTLRQLGRRAEARNQWRLVIEKFPGSPESLLSEGELKMMEAM